MFHTCFVVVDLVGHLVLNICLVLLLQVHMHIELVPMSAIEIHSVT
jgi:hypothetical protein